MTDHYVEFCYSKDGGHTWSNWRRRSLGEQGQYADRIRIRFKQLGQSRQWVFRFRVSSRMLAPCLGGVANMKGLDA